MNRVIKVGENIARERKKRGIKQEDFAELVGVGRTAVQTWERGGGDPRLIQLCQAAEVLALTLDELVYGGTENETVLEQAIETYGADAQLNVAIEEFAELTKEICKYKRYADNTKAIIEEMADCYIMLEQMKMIFGLDNADISNAMDRKIRRLERRIAEKGGAE